MPGGYRATLADVRGALASEGISENSIEPGGAFFFRYGYGKFWTEDPAKILRDYPEFDLEVTEWLIERKVSVVGEETGGSQLPHRELITKNGIFMMEFVALDSVVQDKVYEFLFMMTPIRFRGATGSPGRPLAIR